MHICVSKLTIICSENGLSPGQCQAVIWTIDGILLIWPLCANLSEKFIEIENLHSWNTFESDVCKMSAILSQRPWWMWVIQLLPNHNKTLISIVFFFVSYFHHGKERCCIIWLCMLWLQLLIWIYFSTICFWRMSNDLDAFHRCTHTLFLIFLYKNNACL